MVTFAGTSVGDTATYNCDSGFELIGDAIMTCTLVDGNFAAFSPQPPLCRREHSMCMILERLACVAHTKIRIFTEEQPVRYEGRFNLVAYVAIYIISLACSLSLILN